VVVLVVLVVVAPVVPELVELELPLQATPLHARSSPSVTIFAFCMCESPCGRTPFSRPVFSAPRPPFKKGRTRSAGSRAVLEGVWASFAQEPTRGRSALDGEFREPCILWLGWRGWLARLRGAQLPQRPPWASTASRGPSTNGVGTRGSASRGREAPSRPPALSWRHDLR
jgi:hypothetical protein